jgi:hypothetical protein
VHGGRGEALTGGVKMKEEMDNRKKKEAMDLITMEEEQIK